MTQRLRVDIAPVAHKSRVYIDPDPDDWFTETIDISGFVQHVEVDATVGNATTMVARMILVSGRASAELVPEIQPLQHIRMLDSEQRPWWRFW